MTLTIQGTLKRLTEAARSHDTILVAFSGGKDARATLDICFRTFKRVVPFFMYLVPGLRCIDEQLAIAKSRWGLDVLYVPHWLTVRLLARGIYRPASREFEDLPKDWSIKDSFVQVQEETGIKLIASGAKEKDYWSRRSVMGAMERFGCIHPLAKWNKFDVMGYLKMQGIPLPASSGRMTTGVDLSAPSLLWLHDTYPDDFKKICETFPYAESIVWKRKWYPDAVA